MTQLYTCELTLEVLGPFLTASSSAEAHGIDRVFHRNYKGELVIPASHVKGKLRMALEELTGCFPAGAEADPDALFGRPTAQSHARGADAAANYEPAFARVRFSDFSCGSGAAERVRARVSIDPATQTAGKNLLRTVEDAFGTGDAVTFSGTATFGAADEAEARQLAAVLLAAARWLPNLGAEKGVGFGRLVAAQMSAPRRMVRAAATAALGGSGPLLLRIQPREPILVGGVKSGRTNFIRSRLELPGGAIKGSLAVALNEAFGVRPVHAPLSSSARARYPGFEALVTRFSAIRVTHGLPAQAGAARPVRAPLSVAEVEGEHYDAALRLPPDGLIAGRAPAYCFDSKEPLTYFGAAEPDEIFVTRAAIDDATQRADDGQLFTYSFFAPQNQHGPVEWVAAVSFDAIEDAAERALCRQQFADAAQLRLHRLGKLARQVNVSVEDAVTLAASSRAVIEDGVAVVTLQSDALMLAAADVAGLSPDEDLTALYAAFWAEASGGALRLRDFFAAQGFEGGYLYHRYLGAAERAARPNSYRPYYLTRAGSVFVLESVDEATAAARIRAWLARGLPWPGWAVAEYTLYGRAGWENCPFVAENGYGEIAVNLSWHWERRATSAAQNLEVNDGEAP